MKKFILLAFIPVMLTFEIAAQYSYHNLTFGGRTRAYLIYIPQGYDSTRATPFVIALHGLGDTISNFKDTIKMDQVADTAHFIFAMPQALSDSFGGPAWNSGATPGGYYPNRNIDDVGFVNAMMDSVSLKYNIDQTRLFATGFSMGAFMANRLGCELNNRLAAIASVSGTIGTGIQCNPVRAIAAAHFHGTADPTVPYAGNQFCPGAEALVSYWMHHDHTDTVAASIDTFPNTVNDGKVVVHYKYLNGAYGTEVEFFKVIGGRHEWLSAANDINYSVEIWRFFRRFSWTVQANGIETPKQDLEIGVYPNPASDVVNIQLPTANTISDLSVTDMTGRTVYANHLAASGQLISINTAGFSRGIYMVGVNIAGQRISKKLIVE